MARKRNKDGLKGFIPLKIIVIQIVILMILLLSFFGYMFFPPAPPHNGVHMHVDFRAGLFEEKDPQDGGGGWGVLVNSLSGARAPWGNVGVKVVGPDGNTIVDWKGVSSKKSDLVFENGNDRVFVKSEDIQKVTFENEDGMARLVDRYDELDFDEILTVDNAKVIVYDKMATDTESTVSVNDWLFVFRDPDMDGKEDIPVDSELRVRVDDRLSGKIVLCDCPVSDNSLTIEVHRFNPNSTLTLNGGGWSFDVSLKRGFWGFYPSFAWADISMTVNSTTGVKVLAFDSLDMDNATISFHGLNESWYLYGSSSISFDDAGSLTPLNNSTKNRIVTIEFISLENVTAVIFDNNNNGLMDDGDEVMIFRDSDADGVQDVGPSSSVTLYHKGESLCTLFLG